MRGTLKGGNGAPAGRFLALGMTWSCIVAAAVAMTAAASLSAQTIAADPRVAAAVELAQTWLDGERAYDQIPGVSAAIVHDQEVLWSRGFGWADVASRRPASASTIYSICSISKLFTSVAVLRERDAGHLHLEEPVSKYLSWFKLKKTEGEGDITIEGLLTHASGLPRESDSPYWSPPDYRFPTHEQIVERLSSQSALYPPETYFQYSNLGLTLAGEVVAATSKMPYDAYVRTNILEPLGLKSTTTEMPEAERGKRLATGYTALDREGKRQAMPFFQVRGIGPAAGFASTAEDLARFASWQFRLAERGGTEILKATTLKEMQRVHWVDPDFETLRGLGFNIIKAEGGKAFVGHDGGCPGYRTSLLLSPSDEIAIAFLSNANGVDSIGYARDLFDIVAPAVRAAVKEPEKAKAPDPAMRRYAGTYSAQPWTGEA
ncbi:MAG TPA: serine hydrolase domain-containing protein, partial [Thermoanaerobaculia bacterium]|nr:serine hydrolase domain-containing protein [Thermoanaerobaculia bacterium]